MGPTGKGTSIGIKSNITITSLPKQLAYYFLRIPPKIPTRISVNIFITSLSYPHPSVHHQSAIASFKILYIYEHQYHLHNTSLQNYLSRISSKIIVPKKPPANQPIISPPFHTNRLIIFFQFVNGNCQSRASSEGLGCCGCDCCRRCQYWKHIFHLHNF